MRADGRAGCPGRRRGRASRAARARSPRTAPAVRPTPAPARAPGGVGAERSATAGQATSRRRRYGAAPARGRIRRARRPAAWPGWAGRFPGRRPPGRRHRVVQPVRRAAALIESATWTLPARGSVVAAARPPGKTVRSASCLADHVGERRASRAGSARRAVVAPSGCCRRSGPSSRSSNQSRCWACDAGTSARSPSRPGAAAPLRLVQHAGQLGDRGRLEDGADVEFAPSADRTRLIRLAASSECPPSSKKPSSPDLVHAEYLANTSHRVPPRGVPGAALGRQRTRGRAARRGRACRSGSSAAGPGRTRRAPCNRAARPRAPAAPPGRGRHAGPRDHVGDEPLVARPVLTDHDGGLGDPGRPGRPRSRRARSGNRGS